MSKNNDKREEAMVKANAAKEHKTFDANTPKAKLKLRYQCPACTNTAIETSNKMMGIEVDCAACGKRIKLDDPERYFEL